MSLVRSLRSIGNATGEGPVDWDAVERAAKAATPPGSLDLAPETIDRYRDDVRDARACIRAGTALEFDVPRSVEIQNRHHWIDTNVGTFRRLMEPMEDRWQSVIPEVARIINTGTMTVMLSFLAKNVLGQYDPILLADGDETPHGLYFVHPNIVTVAQELDVEEDRFRRWIAFHEVAHSAEFGAAPWLPGHLEAQMERGLGALSRGQIDRDAFVEIDTTMTVVEGYAELLMDRTFDREVGDLRRKLDERRRGGGPVTQLLRRLLGLGLKRRQYERGVHFFEVVADQRGIEGAGVVWEDPSMLPSSDELDHPDRWLRRIERTTG